jgi:endonuclease YncB( thermonuclease family)
VEKREITELGHVDNVPLGPEPTTVEMDLRQTIPTPRGFVWSFPAQIVSWHDGDTAICHIKVHPNEGGDLYEVNVRIQGINAPELNTAAGIGARNFASALAPGGTDVTLVCTKREKYGRFLARMVLPDGSDFGEAMMRDGQAVPYPT